LRKTLLAGPLYQYGRRVADIGVEQRPLDSVRERRDDSRELGRHACGHMVQDRVPWKVDILTEAAPEMRRALRRRVAIANGVGVRAPVGRFAVAILAAMAPLALAAGDIVLEEHEVAFLEALALRELAAGFGDRPDVLVTHDHGTACERLLVH